MRLEGRTVVLGMSGGIACYKACEIVRLLTLAGARVQVVMTAAAQQFVAPLTLQTLSGNPVATDTFSLTQESEIGHIRLADSADLILIAPATANVLAKLAHGIADDLLTTVCLATRAPLVLAPAMNVHMWEHAAVQENLACLVARGARIVGPASGSLACGYEGTGRLAEPAGIVEAVTALLQPHDLVGERVLVTAGPTHEPLDPVRYLANRSSGKMGYALARVACRRGADVTLVTGPTALPPPHDVRTVNVASAAEMARVVHAEAPRATVIIMAAAVADYRPKSPLVRKMKKGPATLTLDLERTPDILAGLGVNKGKRVLVGFAAETHAVRDEARRKLRSKHLDLIVANDVTAEGAGFGSDTNIVHLIDAKGNEEELPILPKEEVAERILDWIAQHRPTGRRGASSGSVPPGVEGRGAEGAGRSAARNRQPGRRPRT